MIGLPTAFWLIPSSFCRLKRRWIRINFQRLTSAIGIFVWRILYRRESFLYFLSSNKNPLNRSACSESLDCLYKIPRIVEAHFRKGSNELKTAQNMPVPDGVKFLYKHLIDSKQIVDIQGYHAENLHIYSKQVLNMIEHDEEGWEDMVPEKVVQLIKEKCLFGFPAERLVFEY